MFRNLINRFRLWRLRRAIDRLYRLLEDANGRCNDDIIQAMVNAAKTF